MNVNTDIDVRVPHVLGEDEIGLPVATAHEGATITELGGVYAASVDCDGTGDLGDGVVRIPMGEDAYAAYGGFDGDEWDEVPIASA